MLTNLYVIKINDNGLIPLHYWYRKKDEELFVCRYNYKDKQYTTFNSIVEGEHTIGMIQPEHAEIIAEFEYDED